MSLGVILTVALAAAMPPADPPAAIQGVTRYPASFFAPASPTTAYDMVTRLPGFTLDLGANVRGLAGAAGNVLIDGERPVEKQDGLDEILKRIPAGQVLRIDVIRGGAPGIDMQGKTVLANVIRRQVRKPTGVIVLAGVTANGHGVIWATRDQIAATVGKVALEGSLFAGRNYDDGSGDGVRIARAADGTLIGAGKETSLGLGDLYKLTFAATAPVASGKLHLDSSFTSSPYDYHQHDTLAPAGEAFEHDHQTQKTGEAGLSWERALGPTVKLETYLFEQLGSSIYTSDLADSGSAVTLIGSGATSHYLLAKKTSESIARATVTWVPTTTLTIEAGGEGDFNWLRDHTFYIQDGAAQFIPAANVVVTETRGDGFVSATWQARKNVTLEASLRGEISRIGSSGDVEQSKVLGYPKPRAVVTWSPGKSDQIRLRVEREVGQLNFDDFAASNAPVSSGGLHVGNPNIRPQTDWVVEGALDHRFWGGGDVTLTVRRMWLSDVIDRIPVITPEGDFDAPGNIGSGSETDAALALTLPTDKIGLTRGLLTGQGTWRWSRVTDPTTLAPRMISGQHPLDAELHFAQGLPRLKTTWGFDYFAQWRQTNWRFAEIDTDKLKPYLQLFAEYKPTADLSIRFEADNFLRHGFEHGRQVFTGPRNSDPLAFEDVRSVHFPRIFYLRVRKTFG
ncbi:MAG TPA: TonB-dependent receptor [Caulobacteraceae bacterium]|nr:TonB-dependent receptor [Caulobacteraceae bacterium]